MPHTIHSKKDLTQYLIATFEAVSYRDLSQLNHVKSSAEALIKILKGDTMDYRYQLKEVRFAPWSTDATDADYQKSWQMGKDMILEILKNIEANSQLLFPDLPEPLDPAKITAIESSSVMDEQPSPAPTTVLPEEIALATSSLESVAATSDANTPPVQDATVNSSTIESSQAERSDDTVSESKSAQPILFYDEDIPKDSFFTKIFFLTIINFRKLRMIFSSARAPQMDKNNDSISHLAETVQPSRWNQVRHLGVIASSTVAKARRSNFFQAIRIMVRRLSLAHHPEQKDPPIASQPNASLSAEESVPCESPVSQTSIENLADAAPISLEDQNAASIQNQSRDQSTHATGQDTDFIKKSNPANQVLLVTSHGSDVSAKVAKTLTELGLNPIVSALDENFNKSLSQRMEEFTDALCVVVLFIFEGYFYLKDQKVKDSHLVASPKMIFELGYLLGRFGRNKVFVLYSEKKNFELPSAFFDAHYIPYDHNRVWQRELSKALTDFGVILKKKEV